MTYCRFKNYLFFRNITSNTSEIVALSFTQRGPSMCNGLLRTFTGSRTFTGTAYI